MTQLNIFNLQNSEKDIFKLFVDGASRNNPGPAGAGVYLEKNNKKLESHGVFLGNKTNNQAEYLALLFGLFIIKPHLKNNEFIEIISDSELIVRQISGKYKIKNDELKKLYQVAVTILNQLNYKINHILREGNQIADKNANLAIEKKITPTSEFIIFLHQHGISL